MDIQVALKQAKTAVDQNNLQSAQQKLKEILEQDPNAVEAWLILACTHQDSQLKKACLDRALDIDPENAEALKYLQELNPPASDLSTFPGREDDQEFDFNLELPNLYLASSGEMLGTRPANRQKLKVDRKNDQTLPSKSKIRIKPKKPASFFIKILQFLLVIIVVSLAYLGSWYWISQYTTLLFH